MGFLSGNRLGVRLDGIRLSRVGLRCIGLRCIGLDIALGLGPEPTPLRIASGLHLRNFTWLRGLSGSLTSAALIC